MIPKLHRSFLDQSVMSLRLLFLSVAVALGYLGTAAEPSLSQTPSPLSALAPVAMVKSSLP